MEQTPDAPPPSFEFSEPAKLQVHNQDKLRYLLFLFIWMPVMGLVIGAMPESETVLSLLDGVVIVVLIVKWTYRDAEEHGIRLGRHFIPMMVICPGPLILMPMHFIRSRGWGRGAIASLKAFLIFGLLIALEVGAMALANYIFHGE